MGRGKRLILVAVHGGTSVLFQSMAKIRVQNHERKNTSAKLEILYSIFLETICWQISWKPYAGKFLETICWKIVLETICLKIVLETICW